MAGPYEVTALIGEGGMGKVWRAHHTALKRDDALKVRVGQGPTRTMAGATHHRGCGGAGAVGVVRTEGGAMACYRPMFGFRWAVG